MALRQARLILGLKSQEREVVVASSVRILKRALDVGAASIGLAVTLPLYPLIAAAIRLESKGPVFFRQRRAGQLVKSDRNGRGLAFREFEMLKFRTMRADAEAKTGVVLAAENDPRITRVGSFLRKSRLDEVPQLWNVLRGDMSLVGPRPERPELMRDLAMAIPYFEERTRDLKPGITGFAQISLEYTGRAPTGSPLRTWLASLTNPYRLDDIDGNLADDMRLKLLHDLAYAASMESLGSYIRMEAYVLLRTPVVMAMGLGR